MTIERLISLISELKASGYSRLDLRGVIVKHLAGEVTEQAIRDVLDAAELHNARVFYAAC